MTKLLKEEHLIIAWLEKYRIENYTLTPDTEYGFIVDIAGDVDLSRESLTSIKVKFGSITRKFDCSKNSLTNLEGCPVSVGLDFNCSFNKITSLEHCPNSVGGEFRCDSNQLTNLEHCPNSVGGEFRCDSNLLINLEHCPNSVGGYFYCFCNPLLGDYQNFKDFSKLKEKLTSYREKELLSISLKSSKKSILHKV